MLIREDPPDPPWDRIWERIRPCFEECANTVENQISGMLASVTHAKAYASPFSAYLSFTRDRAHQPQEDLIIWLACSVASHMSPVNGGPERQGEPGEPLTMRFFVERGTGKEVTEAARALLPDPEDHEAFVGAMDDYVDHACVVLRDNVPLILATLRGASSATPEESVEP